MNRNYIYIDDADNESGDNTLQSRFKVSKTSRVEYLIGEKQFEPALALIDEILEHDDGDWRNWNLKAVILDNLSEYEKSIECYDNALRICENDEIRLNKSSTLYNWAKISFFPKGEYEKAYELINEALKFIPESEDPSEYYFLKAEILEALRQPIEAKKSYLTAFKEFDKLDEFEKQTEYLNNTSDVLVNISGCFYYNYTPEDGQIVDLIKESDNEHDPDAIAVYLDNEKIGYVANSSYTLFEGFKSASEIKNLNLKKAMIMFVYLDEYVVAKLLEN